jgi:hypothetical protein
MAISIPNATQGGNSVASTSLTLTVPGGAVAGDVMYACVLIGNSVGTCTHASWTTISTLGFGSTQIAVLRRVVNSEPANYTFTTSNHISAGVIILVRGSETGAGYLVASNGAANAASTTMTGNAITSDAANQLNLWVGGTDTHTAANDIVPPTSLTEVLQQTNGASSNYRTICVGYQIKASAGTTSNAEKNGTCAVSDINVVLNYIIREASVAFKNHSLLLSM